MIELLRLHFRSRFPPNFVHLTDSLESLISILEEGLFIRARRRNVWRYFTRRKEFKEREPQQFGMSCLHGFRFRPNKRLVQRFGKFGVCLNRNWVIQNDFRPVLYIKEKGFLHKVFQTQFDEAIRELDSIIENEPKDDAFPRMAFTNQAVSMWLNAKKWSEFLEIFQYMEPVKHSYQSEWRFCRTKPMHNQQTVEEMKRYVKSKSGWTLGISLRKFEPEDVTALFLPKHFEEDTKVAIPAPYNGKPIVSI